MNSSRTEISATLRTETLAGTSVDPLGEWMNENEDLNGSLRGISSHCTESSGIIPPMSSSSWEKSSLSPEGYCTPVYKKRCFGWLDYQPLFGKWAREPSPTEQRKWSLVLWGHTAINYGSLLVLRSLATVKMKSSWGQFKVYVSGILPTYPSPKPVLTLTSHLGQNLGLGEG